MSAVPVAPCVHALAKAIRIPRSQVNDIVHGRRAVTPDTALRLSRHFGTTPAFWTDLQARYERDITGRAARGRDEKTPAPPAVSVAQG